MKANFAFDTYREQYYEGGVSSVYFMDGEGIPGFDVFVLIKKCSSFLFASHMHSLRQDGRVTRMLGFHPPFLRASKGVAVGVSHIGKTGDAQCDLQTQLVCAAMAGCEPLCAGCSQGRAGAPGPTP